LSLQVHRLLDRALALAQDATMVDHRDTHRDLSLFKGGIHRNIWRACPKSCVTAAL
jgi:hypothetical protein